MDEKKELKNQSIEELHSLLNKLLKDKENKVDYIADADQLYAVYDVGTKIFKLNLRPTYTSEQIMNGNTSPLSGESFDISDNCHKQIAEKTKIPRDFYKMLRENHPELLIRNINELIHSGKKVMVRTLYGRARALLTNKYLPVDNYDVMNCSLKNLNDISERDNINIKIMQSNVTEENFHLKVYSPDFVGYINHDKLSPDKVHGGLVISNNEVGDGRFSVKLFIAVIKCDNGFISEKGVSRVHIGRAKDDQVINWSEKTMVLDDLKLMSQLGDLINSAFNRELFEQWIDELNDQASVPVEKPIIALQNVQRDYGIPKELTEQLLVKFTGYGLNKWGLAQTITEYAHTQPSYDKQIELEKAGNIIMTTPIEVLVKEEKLNRSSWRKLETSS